MIQKYQKLIFALCKNAKKHIYDKGVGAMEISKMTLDEIFEMLKVDCVEECRAKAETEYLLQNSKNEISNDEER